MVTSDFNAWSPSCGFSPYNKHGDIVEESITRLNLAILNNSKPTYLSTHSTLAHIDVIPRSPALTPTYTWNIPDDLHKSDQFPIIITSNTAIIQQQITTTRLFLNKANWEKYAVYAQKLITKLTFNKNTNYNAAIFLKIMCTAVNSSIPHTNTFQTKQTHRYAP